MKSTLCLLMAFCAIYASTAALIDRTRILQEVVNIQKRATERVVDDLTRYETQVKSNVEIKFNEIKSTATVIIKDIIDGALEEIEPIVSVSTAVNGNLNHCHEDAKMKLNALRDNGNTELKVCIENANSYLKPTLENVKNNIEVGGKIMTDLDAIIPNCYSSSYIRMQNCVFKKTLAIRSSVRRLRTNVKSVKRTTNTAVSNALGDLRTCMVMPVSNVRTKTTEIIQEANACIRE